MTASQNTFDDNNIQSKKTVNYDTYDKTVQEKLAILLNISPNFFF